MESKIFHAKIGRRALLEALNAILAVTDSGRVNIAPDGVSLTMTDPANVALVHARLKISAFDDYNFLPPEDSHHISQIGLDFERLVAVLSIARAEYVTLSLAAHQAHKLELDIEGLSYSVELIEPSLLRKQPRVPKLELPVAATVFFKEWYRAVRAAEMVDDIAILSADESGLIIEAKGDSDSIRVAFPKLTLLQFTPPPEPGQSVVARFTLPILTQLSKAARSAYADEVSIAFWDDMPLSLQFKIAGGEGDVTFLLAPRVE